MAPVKWSLLLVYLAVVASEKTVFDQDSLTVVDPSVTGNDPNYVDPANCGSKLYEMAVEKDKNLAVNIRVADFNQNSAPYFRAHPSVTKCLQRIFTKVFKATGSKLKLEKGYETTTVTNSYTTYKKKYISSGCGAILKYKTGSGAITEITKAALQSCPMLFEENQRDIGVHVEASSVFIFMTGDSDITPNYSGITSSAANNYIDESLVPTKIPTCTAYTGLDSGSHYPDGVSDPTNIVGAVDEAVTSSMDTDVRRLVQYLGTDVDFTGCTSTTYTGNALSNRCSKRVMSTRMYNVLVNLKAYVKAGSVGGGRLTVEEAWNEGADPSSLRAEGRMIKIKLSSGNTAANLKTVSSLAMCAKADHISHTGGYLYISVKKQKGRAEATVTFPKGLLVAVQPPASKDAQYSLPTEMADEVDDFPLFDSSGRLDTILSENATVGHFVAKDTQFRYFRLSPAISQCYSKLVYHENKWLNDSDSPVEIEIVRAFMSNDEQTALIQSSDERYNTHTLGQALELKYASSMDSNSSAVYTNVRLLKKIVDVCGPVFNTYGANMNLGLYPDSVFVSMDEDQFLFWSNQDSLIPQGYTEQTFDVYLEARREAALQNRVVDPDDLNEACLDPAVPQKQHIDYKYKEPKAIARKRRRRRQTPDSCVPNSATDFCTSTLAHRQAEVDELWKQMSVNKHIYHEPQSEVKTALEGCLLTCGTCLEGSIYERKLEHCSNLIHWMPFDLMNYAADSTNFFARDNLETFGHACGVGNRHCLLKSPLFSILAPSVKKQYRPDPNRSVIESLYSSEENPSPLLSLLEELYAVHAIGVVKFWVADEKEMNSMKLPLQAALMYNPNVTRADIYVTNSISKSPVQGEVEKFVREFSQSGCPTYTREMLAPFEIKEPSDHDRRRRQAVSEETHLELPLFNLLTRDRAHFDTLAP